MSEPLVFLFSKARQGQIESLYILDLFATCSVCGFEPVQRFFLSTPFHTLALGTLTELARNGHERTELGCENCGSDICPDDTERSMVHFGFADDSGIIRVLFDRRRQETFYTLVPRRRLDPQQLPSWPKDDVLKRWHDSVSDEIEDCLGRPLNPKIAWVELMEDWKEDPEEVLWTKAGAGMWLVIGNPEAEQHEPFSIEDPEFLASSADQNVLTIDLVDTKGLANGSSTCPAAGWLHPDRIEELTAGRFFARALVSTKTIYEHLERGLTLGRLAFETSGPAHDLELQITQTPNGVSVSETILVRDVATRATRMGITPGDAGRLRAEEVVGTLMQVWGR